MKRTSTSSSTPFVLLTLATALVSATGCEPTAAPTGTVAGKVTVKGQPLTGAMVTIFSPAIGRGTNCELDDAGSYMTETPLPLSQYSVFVEKLPAPPGEISVPGPPPGVPGEYAASHTTPLKVDVVEGETTFDIAIP